MNQVVHCTCVFEALNESLRALRRLFEMGFAEQLTEILGKMPQQRQTLIVSATLPKALAQFAQVRGHS